MVVTDPSREFVREIATGVENVEVGVEVTVVLIVDRDEGLIVVTDFATDMTVVVRRAQMRLAPACRTSTKGSRFEVH